MKNKKKSGRLTMLLFRSMVVLGRQ